MVVTKGVDVSEKFLILGGGAGVLIEFGEFSKKLEFTPSPCQIITPRGVYAFSLLLRGVPAHNALFQK